jgi:hypothetical protein
MHTETYYRVRTAVRFIFWSAALFLATLGVVALQDVVAALEDDREDCNIVLNRDFTWDSATGEIVNVYSCSAPTNVTLLEDGTWQWTE